MNTISLKGGGNIPVLGFGTWQLTGPACIDAAAAALEIGYRHIDTADAYGNHEQVAEAIRASGIPRRDLFITTKLWNTDHAPDAVIEAGKRFLDELGTDYLDLLLIHWPTSDVPVAETLHAMATLQEQGLVRAIGVSNFTPHHLDDALASGVEIAVNQVEVHPLFNQEALRAYCKGKGIAVTAYSPLGHAQDLNDPTIVEIAGMYQVSPAQVALNWAIGRGMIAIPKSTHRERIEDNFAASTWELAEADLARIDELPQGPRTCNPPFSEFDY